MKNFLIVVDIQNDFVNGALGTAEAVAMLPAAEQKIREWDGEIFVTYDTHFDDYMDSSEGEKLPVAHCIKGTEGWALNARIAEVLDGKEYTAVEKITFGSTELPALIKKAAGDEEFSVTLIGLCTDICVVSNALILKANFPEADISVDSACCAGVTPESHNAALDTMKMCQINII
ncbi:MAG: cysteine hydrolase [Ruminococcaceae bacterium]|nr:cysteine hydrolase [Oscillospiraceae bacterium]